MNYIGNSKVPSKHVWRQNQIILLFEYGLFWEANCVKNYIFFLLCLFKRYIRLLKKGGKVRLRGAAKTLQQSKKMLTHSFFWTHKHRHDFLHSSIICQHINIPFEYPNIICQYTNTSFLFSLWRCCLCLVEQTQQFVTKLSAHIVLPFATP